MERRAIDIRGTVQGVGFRPLVYTLATKMSLTGFVRNDAGGVLIEVQGPPWLLAEFLPQLTAHLPPLARIENLSWEWLPLREETRFEIRASAASTAGPIVIAPDIATCDACLAELLDENDRRHNYAFINCTNCGPRLSIVKGAPYDRERTTMAGFQMCAACQAEYENPLDRRFHAQPIACPACGPRLRARDSLGVVVPIDQPLNWFVDALQNGRIGALKGLGGYQLVCDVSNDAAVVALRERKYRDEKPFAIMVATLAEADSLCEIGIRERTLLASHQRPIVLLNCKTAASSSTTPLSAGIAPGTTQLGVMLPYTPLHHLLLRAFGRPLVMTSGNRSDEPIAFEDEDAVNRLRGIADVFLTHNRPIHVRCDDSVVRLVADQPLPIRRARGYAPESIRLPFECPVPLLAVGGQMKSTFALCHSRHAVLSQHMGDLDHFEASAAFERDVALYEQLFAIEPQRIVHDLHPDYASTRYAQQRARKQNIPLIAVQHHHAHLASCMAEHGLIGQVIGVIWDGTGFGTDGVVWGGEFLTGDYREVHRAAHFRSVPLPGGERAIREPWRIALAHLHDAAIDCPAFEARIPAEALRIARQMIDRKLNSPLTSSAGRLFDAVASLAGVRDFVSYEGQAAVKLEALASAVAVDHAYPFEIHREPTSDRWLVDGRPMFRSIVDDVERGEPPAQIARRLHSTAVEIILSVCQILRNHFGLSRVILSGGVFMNAILLREISGRLAEEQFDVFRHRLVPTNDGGISLGQLAVAASQLTRP